MREARPKGRHNGVKLTKTVTKAGQAMNTHYRDGFQYIEDDLDFFPHAACLRRGRYDREEDTLEVTQNPNLVNDSYNYIFHYLDHYCLRRATIGVERKTHIRIRYAKDTSNDTVKILEEKHYYPACLRRATIGVERKAQQHKGYNQQRSGFRSKALNNTIVLTPIDPFVGSTYTYGFGGKEFEESLGANWLEYGARNYDPALGRFTNIDRMTEMYETLNPYNYTANNPVNSIDVNGEWIYIHDGDNKYRYENGSAQQQGEDGEWTNVANNSLSSEVSSTITALNKLGKSGNTGNGLINSFSNDENNIDFKFVSGKKPIYNDGVLSLDANQTEQYFVQGEDGPVLENSQLFVSIGHELAHATDPTKFYGTSWYNVNVSESEIRASHVENMIRSESGLPLRTHYGVNENKATGVISPSINSTLIDSQGNSVYYSRSNRRINYPNLYNIKGSIRDGIRAHGGEILKARYNYEENNPQK